MQKNYYIRNPGDRIINNQFIMLSYRFVIRPIYSDQIINVL